MMWDSDNPSVAGKGLTVAPPHNGASLTGSYEIERELLVAHRESFNNRQRLLTYGGTCGCFHCLGQFEASAVTMWVGRGEATALCPFCHIDAVLQRNDEQFLALMQTCCFFSSTKVRLDLRSGKTSKRPSHRRRGGCETNHAP